jgi:hypothetical protein
VIFQQTGSSYEWLITDAQADGAAAAAQVGLPLTTYDYLLAGLQA